MHIGPNEIPDLTPDDTQALIEYARRKFAEERWPLSPELRPVREVLTKIDPKPKPEPPPPRRPHVPSMVLNKKRRR
jgi:hypothetical protein